MANGQQVKYIRVSNIGQNTARQLDDVEADKTFTDKASGKDSNRPALAECIDYLRAGDTLHVHSMDRLARNLDDLRRIVRELTGKGVAIRFHKEGLTFTGEDSPMSNLLLSMLGAVAEFERSLIAERRQEGIEIAKAKGDVYKGRKPSLTDEQAAELKQRAASGEQKAALAKEYGISRATLYGYIGR